MLGKTEVILIWLAPSEVYLLEAGKEEHKSMVVPATIVSDMEVKNKDELYSLIKSWLAEHTYSKEEIVWIVDEQLCFSQTFTTEKNEALDTAVVKFLELLPFTDTYSHVYDTVDGGKQVIAINKSLFDAYRQGFAVQGYETKLVIPESRLPADWQKRGPVKELYTEVQAKLAELTKDNLVEQMFFQNEQGVKNIVEDNKKERSQAKSQIKLLLSVFALLLLILFFVVYITYLRA